MQALLLVAALAATPELERFRAEVWPVLQRRCLSCHGEDAEGGLRLDDRAAILKGGDGGPAAVPGDPDASLLVQAVRRTHAKLAMPPKKPLPPEEVAALVEWVRGGLAFAPPPTPVAAVDHERLRLRGRDGAGPMPLRRLTGAEYLATVRDLFGVKPALKFALPQDPIGTSGFPSAGVVSGVEAARFLAAAEQLAAAAVPRLPLLLPCAPEIDGEAPCARAFVRDFGLRAFRRPLTDPEARRLEALRRRGRSFEDGLRLAMAAMLASPQFLYHWEAPPAPGAVAPLGPYALASRLSYFLTGSMPDDALFAAAAADALGTPEQVAAHARRLIASGRAKATVLAFHDHWLHLDRVRDLQKDKKLYPQFSPALVLAMERETRAFVEHVFFGDGKLETLFLADHSFVNEPLAKLYGIAGVKGKELRRVQLPPERRGLLTQASFLAVEALPNNHSPVRRGKAIMEHLLCRPPPPPPPGLDVSPPPPDPKAQTRELYAEHAENKACAGCHANLDPIGFAFEAFDAVGRHRREENGRPVDTTGRLPLAGGERPFSDARGLIELVARSDELRRCVVKKWLRFALGRPETVEEAPSVEEILGAFAATGYDLRELLVAVATSKAFRYRFGP